MTNEEFGVSASPSGNGTLAIVRRGAREGTDDAAQAAARFLTSTGLMVSQILYTSAYTFSFSLVLPAVYIARAIPAKNAMIQGLVDGADAAGRKADEVFNCV